MNNARLVFPVLATCRQVGNSSFLESIPRLQIRTISSVIDSQRPVLDRQITPGLQTSFSYNYSYLNSRTISQYSRLCAQLKQDSESAQDKSASPAAPQDSDKEKSAQASEEKSEEKPEESTAKLTVFQRFKKTYKEHGKVLVGVHLFTSTIWFGSFYYAASVGFDVIPVMEWMGMSEKIINPFRNSSLGDVALAYLMYKLATPARYTVTLGGTNFMVKYLRKTGKIEPKQATESLRSLAKESRAEMQHKTKKLRSEMTRKQTKVRKVMRNKVDERKFKFHSKVRNLKERRHLLAAKFKGRQNMVAHKLKHKGQKGK